jgi:hypothetical protein
MDCLLKTQAWENAASARPFPPHLKPVLNTRALQPTCSEVFAGSGLTEQGCCRVGVPCLVNMLPTDGRARQIVGIIVIIIGSSRY